MYRLRVVVKDRSTHRLIRRSKTVHVPERGNVKQLEDEMAKFRTEVSEMARKGTKATVGRLLDEWIEKLDPALARNTVEAYSKRFRMKGAHIPPRPTIGWANQGVIP